MGACISYEGKYLTHKSTLVENKSEAMIFNNQERALSFLRNNLKKEIDIKKTEIIPAKKKKKKKSSSKKKTTNGTRLSNTDKKISKYYHLIELCPRLPANVVYKIYDSLRDTLIDRRDIKGELGQNVNKVRNQPQLLISFGNEIGIEIQKYLKRV